MYRGLRNYNLCNVFLFDKIYFKRLDAKQNVYSVSFHLQKNKQYYCISMQS